MTATLLPLLFVTVQAHIWFPEGYPKRELTTADCTTGPKWNTAYSASPTDKYSSYHLHLAYAGGNTAQVAAAAKFKTLANTDAGMSTSCTSVSDTNDYFVSSS